MLRKPSLGLEDLLHSIVQSVTDVQYDRPQHQKLADGPPASILEETFKNIPGHWHGLHGWLERS